MRIFFVSIRLLVLAAVLAAAFSSAAPGPKLLILYAIDVEGGQATLFVAPSGESLLIDTGWGGNDGRDARRIEAAMRDAGLHRLDHVLITHYHTDHVGGVRNLLARVKVGEFLDHGVNREDAPDVKALYQDYLKAVASQKRRTLKSGDTIPVAGLKIDVLTADGQHTARVPGIEPVPNPACSAEPAPPADETENPRSVGVLVRFGRFRVLDLGDLTRDKELELVCPANPIGAIDLFVVSHHGYTLSNSRALVSAIHARVALMDNGAHKAGSPDAWERVEAGPGLVQLWQLHTAEDSDARHNVDQAHIANLKGEAGDGYWLKAVALEDGSFTVTNQRTGQTQQYPAR
jgi:beta-lactamase superfamily II metal-dependent hydrolase